jgi:hypothetical protein
MMYLGDYAEDATIDFMWSSNAADGASITRSTDGTISVYKANGTTQSTAGITDTEDFDSLTGIHHVRIDLSADAFYAVANDYMVVLSAATIDGETVNAVLAHFSIENRYNPVTDFDPPTRAELTSDINSVLNILGTPAGADMSADIAAIEAQTDDIGAAGAGLTAVPWNADWDAEVQSEVNDALVAIHLDHLLATDYDPASKPGTSTALLNELVENDGGVSRFTANALEQGPSGSGASASDIADAVWTETLADHSGTSGSTAEALSNIPGAAAGSTEVTDILIDDGTDPIEGAAVWISTDSAGSNVVWAGTTNASGVPKDTNGENPFLDAGTYYVWVQLGGYSFSNPTSKTVS